MTCRTYYIHKLHSEQFVSTCHPTACLSYSLPRHQSYPIGPHESCTVKVGRRKVTGVGGEFARRRKHVSQMSVTCQATDKA